MFPFFAKGGRSYRKCSQIWRFEKMYDATAQEKEKACCSETTITYNSKCNSDIEK